jgi:hypothetical protein
MTVEVPGLKNLPTANPPNLYLLKGDTAQHGIGTNHFALADTNQRLYLLAFDYMEATGQPLEINDMSLEKGGVFDICGKWTPSGTCNNAPHGGHKTHRTGKSVDINGDAATLSSPGVRVPVNTDKLIEVIKTKDINGCRVRERQFM